MDDDKIYKNMIYWSIAEEVWLNDDGVPKPNRYGFPESKAPYKKYFINKRKILEGELYREYGEPDNLLPYQIGTKNCCATITLDNGQIKKYNGQLGSDLYHVLRGLNFQYSNTAFLGIFSPEGHRFVAVPTKIDLTLFNQTNKELNFQWEEAKIGRSYPSGSPVINYEIQYQKLGESNWNSEVYSKEILSTFITVLESNTTYNFRIRSKNSVGYSDWSNELQVIIP